MPGKTVDRVGVKSCIICDTGAEEQRITIVLTVTANGTMLPPTVIVKGKHHLKLIAPEGVLVCMDESIAGGTIPQMYPAALHQEDR